jgi:RimJ/RimL family protein N-acetyltransferase
MKPDPETQPTQPALPTTIQTDRLILRLFDPSQPADYAAVLSIYDSPYAHRTVGNIGLTTREDVDNRCRRFDLRRPRTTRSPPCFSSSSSTPIPIPTHPWHLVYLRDNNKPGRQPDMPEDNTTNTSMVLIGLTSLFLRHPVPSPDLGYFIQEEYTGKGYATEAGKAALKWWTEEMGVRDIWAGTMDTNHASQRVARKIGFVDGGVLRLLVADGVVVEGRAFVQPGMGKWLDGVVVVDVRQREGVSMEVSKDSNECESAKETVTR